VATAVIGSHMSNHIVVSVLVKEVDEKGNTLKTHASHEEFTTVDYIDKDGRLPNWFFNVVYSGFNWIRNTIIGVDGKLDSKDFDN
jgi:hypothetical protein